MVRVLYFAMLRERMGRGEEALALPEGVGSVGGLAAWLQRRDGAGERAFGGGMVVRAAVNQEFAGMGEVVRDGDEVAFFPPVTGG